MPNIQRTPTHFEYRSKRIGFSLWSNLLPGQKPDVAILLGAGQIEPLPRMVAKRSGPGVVVIGGVPHWHARADASEVADFTYCYFESAYRAALATFHVPSLHILAESQAAPAGLLLAGKLKEAVRNVALIRPLGFSVEAYGENPEERLKTFRRRILRTMLQHRQSILYDPRNFVATATLTRAMLREPSLKSLNQKYAAGISYDSTKDLEQAAEIRDKTGNTISIILGGKDKMFPATEVQATLKNLHIPQVEVVVLPGASHSPISIRDSQKVLKTSLDMLRGSR